VLVLLFVKYITDKYAGQPYAPITIPPGASFKDLVALKGTSDIGDQINKKILGPLAERNKLSDMPDFNDATKLGSGKEMVDRLTNLIAIFETPALDFSKNRADGDDILGDAYEYLMRHFATESGKSKGQFYTPAEVSRVIAQVLGIRYANTTNDTTVYDPTCGSGSLLLKVGDEASHSRNVRVTLYGQEKDSATAGLARMNMILHDQATALIEQGNTLSNPLFMDGHTIKTFDYVVANPPFSDKRWSTGLDAENDPHERFRHFGTPPAKQGDYAYLLHILRSLKSTGKGACILPHGVLFRGNAEAVIRKNLIRRGYIKAIIGLPPNLFYGTGIPACIILLDKSEASARKGIFMVDAAKGFMKDGNKNRLRAADIHKIVDVCTRQVEVSRYSRMVPVAEISNPKNDFNLNLPRYIDSTEPEDLQDIDAHLNGGIPERDLDALDRYWQIFPAVREALFVPDRPGYSQLRVPIGEVKATIFGHPEFTTFNESATGLFAEWSAKTTPAFKSIDQDTKPKSLIEILAEDLLTTFQNAPLLDQYDIYQHLMDYWAETMQDDVYMIVADGWVEAAKPRLIIDERGSRSTEKPDLIVARKKYKTELIPHTLVIDRYFTTEQAAIEQLEADVAAIEQQMEEMAEEHSGEEGLLEEAKTDAGKINKVSVKARIREIGRDADAADELKVLNEYLDLIEKAAENSTKAKIAHESLMAEVLVKYGQLSEEEIKALVIDGKWMVAVATAVQGELDRVSQTLTGRIRQLAERYATPLAQLIGDVAKLSRKADAHLAKMGFSEMGEDKVVHVNTADIY
jgi:type I restriction enzyme M protein